ASAGKCSPAFEAPRKRRSRSRKSFSLFQHSRFSRANCAAAPLFFSCRKPSANPRNVRNRHSLMSKTNVEQVILRLENYLECWKQYNTFMSTARTKKFSPEDENQFLELKSVLT